MSKPTFLRCLKAAGALAAAIALSGCIVVPVGPRYGYGYGYGYRPHPYYY